MKKSKIELFPIQDNEPIESASFLPSDTCARCQNPISEKQMKGFYVREYDSANIYILEYCQKCNRLSLREFMHVYPSIFAGSIYPYEEAPSFDMTQCFSTRHFTDYELSNFGECIEKLSPLC